MLNCRCATCWGECLPDQTYCCNSCQVEAELRRPELAAYPFPGDAAPAPSGASSSFPPQPDPSQGEKPSNPKDALGINKLPLGLWPATATAMGCLALLEGGCKYGLYNFREIGVRTSVYIDAALRHLFAYQQGEDTDTDSGIPHLGKALACLAILIDADAHGKLEDDRPLTTGGYGAIVRELTPLVAKLRHAHAGKNPEHYVRSNTLKDDQ